MNNSSANSHKRVEHSTTLNRKYVKRPTPKVRTSAEIHAENLKRRQALAARMNRERLLNLKSTKKPATKKPVTKIDTPIEKGKKHPLEISARNRLSQKFNHESQAPALSMKEKKEQAIESALKAMSSKKQPEKKHLMKSFFSTQRIALALCCAIFVVGITVFFVNLSMPNISVSVAAMKAGIDASFPSYIPKNFSLSNVKTEDERISLVFKSNSDEAFVLTEEKSSWNSSALEANYAKPLFKNNYSTVREQGLTLYISGSNCVWVNGGKLFTISSEANLTKAQLTSIATSLQ